MLIEELAKKYQKPKKKRKEKTKDEKAVEFVSLLREYFKGDKPIKGEDYFTDAELAEIKSDIVNSLSEVLEKFDKKLHETLQKEEKIDKNLEVVKMETEDSIKNIVIDFTKEFSKLNKILEEKEKQINKLKVKNKKEKKDLIEKIKNLKNDIRNVELKINKKKVTLADLDKEEIRKWILSLIIRNMPRSFSGGGSGGGSGSGDTYKIKINASDGNPDFIANKIDTDTLDVDADAFLLKVKDNVFAFKTHTHVASDITDFDSAVSSNSDVSANTNHRSMTDNPHNVTKEQVGLGNVLNVEQIPASEKGVANGVATLDSSGKVFSSQLPSYVDDVLEYNTENDFPATGESGKIYVAKDTNKTYRWSGSDYVEISPSLALGTTHETAFYGDWGNTAYQHSQVTSGNPHNVTAGDVGAYTKSETDSLLDDKEDKANKVTSWQSTPDDTHYPSEKLVKDNLDNKANKVHTHVASDITDFDSAVSNNSDVSANTTHRGRTDNPHNVTATQVNAYTKTEVDNLLNDKADLVDGKVPESELPDPVIYFGDEFTMQNRLFTGRPFDETFDTNTLPSYFTFASDSPFSVPNENTTQDNVANTYTLYRPSVLLFDARNINIFAYRSGAPFSSLPHGLVANAGFLVGFDTAFTGIRLDDGTNNNYVEFGLHYDAGSVMWKWRVRWKSGSNSGDTVTSDGINLPFPMNLLAWLNGTAWSSWKLNGYISLPFAAPMPLQMKKVASDSLSWTLKGMDCLLTMAVV